MRRLYLEILSPVHIGCDDVYEPTSFVVDEKNSRLLVFDPMEFFAGLDEPTQARFSEICMKGTVRSILEMYQFLRRREARGRHIDVCAGFLRNYERTLSLSSCSERDLMGQLNDFAIPRTAYLCDTGRPYIPGSALKGAIRTAYLNSLYKTKPRRGFKGKYAASDFERYLMDGQFDTDPFRLVSVSDFLPVGEIKTRVIFAVNKKKHPARYEAGGPPQMLEVILPSAVFTGTISVERPLRESGIRNTPTWETLWSSMNSFYKAEKMREDVDLTRIRARPVVIENGIDEALLRIGRHCGAESVTVEGHRDIKIIQPRGGETKYDRHATTLWLAAGDRRPREGELLEPFGWVLLSEPEEMFRVQLEDTELEWREHFEKRAESRIAERDRALEIVAEKKRMEREEADRKRREQEQREREEERRKTEEAAMTPEQRAIARVKSPDVPENEVVEIFSGLDEFEDKQALAHALKEYWVRVGKWNKKACSKKQWKKVQKVSSILNDT